jgi:hypothetical protein
LLHFSDTIAGSFFIRLDPESIALEPSAANEELRRHREKEVLNLAFGYRKRFQLDISTVNNCTFVRQLKAFIHAFNKYDQDRRREQEGFYQKSFHIMTEGGKRIQTSILTYLCDRRASAEAITLAVKMGISRKDWPSCMKFAGDFVDEVTEKYASW